MFFPPPGLTDQMDLDFILELSRRSMRNASLFFGALLAVIVLGLLWAYAGIFVFAAGLLVFLFKAADALRGQRCESGEPISSLPPLSRDDLRAAQSKLKGYSSRK